LGAAAGRRTIVADPTWSVEGESLRIVEGEGWDPHGANGELVMAAVRRAILAGLERAAAMLDFVVVGHSMANDAAAVEALTQAAQDIRDEAKPAGPARREEKP